MTGPYTSDLLPVGTPVSWQCPNGARYSGTVIADHPLGISYRKPVRRIRVCGTDGMSYVVPLSLVVA